MKVHFWIVVTCILEDVSSVVEHLYANFKCSGYECITLNYVQLLTSSRVFLLQDLVKMFSVVPQLYSLQGVWCPPYLLNVFISWLSQTEEFTILKDTKA